MYFLCPRFWRLFCCGFRCSGRHVVFEQFFVLRELAFQSLYTCALLAGADWAISDSSALARFTGVAGSEAESGEDFVARFDAGVDVSSTLIVACFWEAGVRSFRVRLGMAFSLSSSMASESTDVAERWVEPAPAWAAAVPCGLASGFGTTKNSGTVGGPGGQSFRCSFSKRRIAASAALARASSAALESVHAGRGSGCSSWGWGAARSPPPSVPRPTRD